MILIVDENLAAVLCQDGKFRRFANFGTYPECIKVYRSLGWAKRKQDLFERWGREVVVTKLPNGHSVDAVGWEFDKNERLIGKVW